MEDCRRGLAHLLLEGDLGAVTLGLEQGLFSWDELDLPQNSDGSTPLLNACQMGLRMVIHFLLERGADPTLCNHSNQTALHISPPDLQRELLEAIARPSYHKGQLLGAAWRGDINTLEHLLTQTDLIDVNTQNRDGLTALMLAVRDVDLFDGLQDIIPWDYQPTETVKALLALSPSVEMKDLKGYTVHNYASQIKSPIKNELLQNISGSSAPTPMEPQFLVDCSTNSPSCPPPLAASVLESCEDISIQESHKDFSKAKIILFFQTSMEPKRSTRQGPLQLSKAIGWTSSLPNLQDRKKCWDKLGSLHSPSEVPLKTSFIPIPPRLAEKSKPILESPLVPHLSHLSQSAPSSALVDASVLLQVRKNIYNRLSGEADSDSNRQKSPPPIPFPRTPKHLAPLERQQDCPVLSSLQRPFLLKPISITPASSVSRQRRERLSGLSQRGSRGTRRGSAESASSSSSSESSVDLDEEDEEKEEVEEDESHPLELPLSTFLRKPQNILESPSEHLLNLDRRGIDSHNEDLLIKCQFKRSQEVEALMSQDCLDDCEQNKDRYSVDFLKIEKNGKSGESFDLDGPKDAEVRPLLSQEKPGSFADPDQHNVSPENIKVLEQVSVEKGKMKTTKGKERKCTPFHTSQSFNALAHRNTNWGTVHPKRNRRNSAISSQAKINNMNSNYDHVIRGSDCPRMAPTKQSQRPKDTPLTRRKASELPCEIKMNGDKKSLNKCHSQKELLNQDRKTARQPKKTGNVGSLRAKSALDSVSYSDMFLQIHKEDKGPAIFEMFATPLYENLREGHSAEKTKQMQPPPQVKRSSNGPRGKKNMEGNRRKCSLAKSKPRKRRDSQPSRPQNFHQPFDLNEDSTAVIAGLDGNCHISNREIVTNEDGKGDICETKQENEGPVLSVIKDICSASATAKSIHLEQKDLATSSRSALSPGINGEIIHLKSDILENNWDLSNNMGDVVVDKFPAEPMINTWTSGRKTSPVYQRFLDELGDGPVTDDLLRCLAEELISLEEKEVETLKSEHTKDKVIITDPQPKLNKVLNEERSSINDTITWTKGEVLGRGAYGTVYCGLTSQGQLIAVKQVLLDVSSSETAQNEYNQLEREVDLLKNLNHPNIVGFLGTALTDNIISIFIEYVPGGSIFSVLNRFGPLPENVFALYTKQILEGVAYLHDNRVIHRDLKGNNLMLMPTGIVKMIDFGCACRLNCLTRSGGNSDLLKSVHGTPYWMAPEVIDETGHGKKSDIWSIGCTVFEMATGKPPLAHMGKMAALFYIGARKGSMPSLPDGFSDEAKNFVKVCLISNQKQRPSAADLLRHPFIVQLRQPRSSKLHIQTTS